LARDPVLARDPTADLATLRAVHETARGGDHAGAAVLAEAALADGLEHPLLFNLKALALEQQGRLAEAEALLQRALTVAPRDIGVRNALGLLLLRLERPADAMLQFTALLQLDAALPFAHASLGNAYFALGLIAEAEASYRRSLERDAQQGVALSGLARIAVSRGAYPEARGWAERAVAALPGFPDAVMSLAAVELSERRVTDAEARLRALLADQRISTLERAYANGLLGDVLDAKNYTDAAFAAYSACNRELQALYGQRFSGEGRALAFVQSMEQHFRAADPQIWAARPPPDKRRTGAAGHVFLLGFPRSGTTLLEVILEGHPNVVSLEENESLIGAVQEFMRQPADVGKVAVAPPAVLERLRTDYWRQVAATGTDVMGKLFVDKNPLNTLKLPLIARLFPDAKILFACRDPRDIVLSCFRHRFRMSAPIHELLTIEGAATYYDAVMRLTLQFSRFFSLDTCLVRHEDVVSEFKREMTRICDFLGIEWDPAMGDFALRTQYRESLTPSTAQLVKGLSTEGLGQWRRYRPHLAPVLVTLEPWVKRFFYDE
jgi:tetratricopeptide (TPR) repeat protein